MPEEPKIKLTAVPGMFPTKPDPAKVFYANFIQWATTLQDVVFDFKLVTPEDYTITTEPTAEKEGEAQFELAKIPVVVRVIVPKLVFDQMVSTLVGASVSISTEAQDATTKD